MISKHSVKIKFDAKSAFELGRHREVLERTKWASASSPASAAYIASLASVGQTDDAKVLFEERMEKLKPADRARARFTLALAYTRLSRFKLARKLLLENRDDPKCKDLPDVFQGIGIYYYYTGRFQKSASFAKRAMKSSLARQDDYIHALATDLYGHALVQTGHRSAGIRLLEQARTKSKTTGASDPFSTERLIYEAEAGLRPESIVTELQTVLEAGPAETFYTRANLTLELARQLTLRGSWQEARQLLDREAPSIYSFQNRRQEALLQLRLAEIAYRQNDAPSATHFLQAARRCLKKVVDNAFEIRILGLEQKVERRLLGREPNEQSSARMLALSKICEGAMSARILARTTSGPAPESPHGEDPLGDLLDLVSKSPRQGLRELLSKGYLGLWPEAKKLATTDSQLVILENQRWLTIDRGGVKMAAAALSPTSKKILRVLALGKTDKEGLIKSVWGYEYDPLRHDATIYAALAALRKALGPASSWIQTLDDGWKLTAHLVDESPTSDSGEVENAQISKLNVTTKTIFAAELRDLNWRQIKVVEDLETKSVWTPGSYRESFAVSTMTAWRDLDDLVQKRYLIKTGAGRGTAYLKGTDS